MRSLLLANALSGNPADPATPRSFLVSTHYTRYDSHPALFTLNLISLILVGLAPKLPMFHRLRFKFFDAGVTPGTFPSQPRREDFVALNDSCRTLGTSDPCRRVDAGWRA